MTKRTRNKVASLKENVVPRKLKALTANKNQHVQSKSVKPLRKAFMDKTNSASDDNASNETPQKLVSCKTQNVQENLHDPEIKNNKERPSRERPKNKKNCIANKLSSVPKAMTINASCEPINKSNTLDSVLSYSRPKRICRLPSKFEDHDVSLFTNQHGNIKYNTGKTEISENKVKCLSSTEISPKNNKNVIVQDIKSPNMSQKTRSSVNNRIYNLEMSHETVKRKHNMVVSTPVNMDKLKTVPSKNTNTKRLLDKNTSVRLLESKKRLPNTSAENIDVYEFTYDPSEEPPQKKKRKRTVRKKPPIKQKTIIFKNNYDTNLSKTLASLKSVVSKNSTQTPMPVKTNTVRMNTNQSPNPSTNNVKSNSSKMVSGDQYNKISVKNKELQTSRDHDNINYSPVNSPNHSNNTFQSLNLENQINDNNIDHIHNNDPLNLQEESSFFDVPVASSSMNMSARRHMASPWRVEFENLPIKWQVNTYVKPNMTPAVESSFINFNETKKKHVYADMVINPNDVTLNSHDNEAPKLQQTSIISFLKEVIEKSTKKKKRGLSVTPIKTNPISKNTDVSIEPFTPDKVLNKELATPDRITPQSSTCSNESLNSVTKDTRLFQKGRHSVNKKDTPLNANRKNSYFGFDVTDSPDKENINENIDKQRVQALRPRARAILQEFNQQMGPSRVVIPVSKSKFTSNSDMVNKMYEGIKSATDAPAIPDIIVENVGDSTNVDDALWQNVVESEDSQSVHLFEDIEVVHHLKPPRKSYSKDVKNQKMSKKEQSQRTRGLETNKQKLSKKEKTQVSFAQETMIQKDEPFEKSYPKKTKKKMLSKKEQQEADAWAAGFNSMCEDIDEFDLVVE